MTFLRPAALASLRRWADPAAGIVTALLGVLAMVRGGWFLGPLGAVLLAIGIGWTLLALRRLRFHADPDAPGLVEVDEGRVRYLHPVLAGEVSLDELVEIRLAHYRGRRIWRLVDGAGRNLLIPLDAAGAPALFDSFATLPGLSTADLVAALSPPGSPGAAASPSLALALDDRAVWHRKGAAIISFRDRTARRS